jgi:hypothetical protein
MQTVFMVAKVLSAAALLALVAALVNLWRRPSVPPFSYGAVSLSQRRLKGLWSAFLLGALVVASNNDPVLRNTRDTDEPVPASTDAHAKSIYSSLNMPLPFYHYKSTARRVSGTVVEEHIEEGVALPWSFLWALLAYYVLVVRWNPDSRWAKRVLEGRKAAKPSNESDDVDADG